MPPGTEMPFGPGPNRRVSHRLTSTGARLCLAGRRARPGRPVRSPDRGGAGAATGIIGMQKNVPPELPPERHPLVSIVVPIYNEQDNLVELHRQLCDTLDPLTRDYEFLFIDDGSTDASVAQIEALRGQDQRVRLIEFSRNFGKELAILAGYDHGRGRAVIVMDADLQNPPEVVREMIGKWRDGAAVVDAIRTETVGQGTLRRWASSLFYRLMSRLANTAIIPNCVDFRLLDRAVVRELRRCRERHRFNRALVSWVGFPRAAVHYVAPARGGGSSRWGFFRLVGYAMDAIASFSSLPLRIAGLLGLALAASSFLYLIVLMVDRLFFRNPWQGYASLAGGLFLLGGVQLTTIWLLGEYVGRVYEEGKGRPLYVIKRILDPPASCPTQDPGETEARET